MADQHVHTSCRLARQLLLTQADLAGSWGAAQVWIQSHSRQGVAQYRKTRRGEWCQLCSMPGEQGTQAMPPWQGSQDGISLRS